MTDTSVGRPGFTEEEAARLAALSRLYSEAKSLILYAEEVDPDARSNLQIIKELRDAFDHLMRAISVRFDASRSPGDDDQAYCSNNLSKAEGHVYRAAFDALDGALLSLRVKIAEVASQYPLEALSQVVPDYWRLKRDLERLSTQVAEHRAGKDVGRQISATLDRYVEDVTQVKCFYDELLGCAPLLDEYVAKAKREQLGNDHRLFWVSVIAATIGALAPPTQRIPLVNSS